jgi:hypothetical protein
MASTNDEPTSSIIKSDRTGRPRYTQDYRDEVLTAYESSGMSGPAFAAHCGLKYPTFATWVARRRRGDGIPRKAVGPGRFVFAELAPGDGGAGEVRVTLPGGAVAMLERPGQAVLLAELIKALA